MKLSECILRPAKVVEVMDNNIIKVTAPGIFSTEDDVSKLPPVYPFIEMTKNAFSGVAIGDEVWLLSVKDNSQELFWLRKPDSDFGYEDLPAGKNLEVLARRESGASWAEIYFTDGTGWVIRNDSSKIVIDSDGNIVLSAPGYHKTIEINDMGISLGTKGGSAEPAVLGDKLTDVLEYISIMFDSISTMAAANPYTFPLSVPINSLKAGLDDKIKHICSSYVTLD